MKFITLSITYILILTQQVYAERFVPKSDLIYRVLHFVERSYIDEKRIIPIEMLEGSLERLSVRIAPVLTQMEVKGNKVLIQVSVDKYSTVIESATPNSILELNEILQKIVRFTKHHLEEGEESDSVDYSVINGFLKTLDPHSLLLIPQVYSEFTTNTSGNFGGVGMMIGLREGLLTIIAPIDDTPASRAGLQAKDHIAQINDESTINMSLSDAVSKLRGKEGTEVVLYINRKGLTTPRRYIIIRDLIKITSVESSQFEVEKKRVGYLKVKTFQKNTLKEINSELEKLDYDLNDFYGLILDLRNNPGGLLDQAIKVSDRFLDGGEIVSTAGLSPKGPRNIRTSSANWFGSIVDIPMVVLVNSGSASASEIVTAALKKNNRAVVIGTQTFGKGSVQQVIPLPGGSALKLTTSKYLTPGRISIQSVGVTPHIAVLTKYVSTDLLQVVPSKSNRVENSLEHNFAEWGDKAEAARKTTFFLYQEEEEKIDEEGDLKELKKQRQERDFLLQTAKKIILENRRKSFKNLLKTSLAFMDQEEQVQEQKMIKKFSEFTTDWKSYQTTPGAKIESKIWIELKDSMNDKDKWVRTNPRIPADREIRLFLKAKNVGTQKVSRLIATSESKNPMFDDRQFAFGKLEPGEAREWFLPIKVSKSVLSRNDLIKFQFSDQEKREMHNAKFTVDIKAQQRPSFKYTISTLDDGTHGSSGNGDGVLQVNETIVLKIALTNQGIGTSGSLTLTLKNGEGKRVFLKKGRHNSEPLKEKQTSVAYFQFDLKSVPADKNLNFSLDIIDGTYPLKSINHKFKIPLRNLMGVISNQAPDIAVENKNLVSSQRSYPLKGHINDDKGVKDVYIFNSKKKVFYKNFSNKSDRKSVDFKLDLKLEDKNNQIVIISRDDENVITQKNLYVRYSGSI
ncbi:MAG: hypothetical protein GY786_18325 [Proteobacteria bacterium]|nr:hypothetical protein [Pseudomonadota bacterium]